MRLLVYAGGGIESVFLFCRSVFFLFFRDHKIKNDGNKENDGYAVFSENSAEDIRENGEHYRRLRKTKTNAERAATVIFL